MAKKIKRKGLRMTPRTIQKFKLKHVVISSSILAIIGISTIYLNFSQSEISKAADSDKGFNLTYRTTDIVVPKRMLLDISTQKRVAVEGYKSNPNIKHDDVSRATDIVIKNEQQ